MTKKHFIELADVIKDSPSLFNDTARLALACFCGRQNPQFNRERWLAYIAGKCGSNGGEIKPPRQPRPVKPERKLARRLEGN